MHLMIEIPQDRAERFEQQARARGLSVDRWLLELADENSRVLAVDAIARPTFSQVCAKVRGLAEDLDLRRDPSPGRDVAL